MKPEMQDEGQPKECVRGVARGVRIRGNPKLHNRQRGNLQNRGDLRKQSRHSQWTEDSGQLGASSPVRMKDAETGKPENANLAQPEGSGEGATRNPDPEAEGTMHDPMSL